MFVRRRGLPGEWRAFRRLARLFWGVGIFGW
jgi:hypothetical protein